jgi:phosphoribosylglycinamide formyltransferase-1
VNIALFISGRGSNMDAILAACQAGHIAATPALVISNKADAKGLLTAATAGIPTAVFDHREFASREDFDRAILARVQQHNIDLIILAGFMRILTPELIRPFHGRMLNIHPSLLPKYPGLNTHQRAIDAKDTMAGATVHFVIEELDAGPAVLQASVDISEQDDASSLQRKVLEVEHTIYPLAIKWVVEGRVRLHEGKAFLDNEPLPPSGVRIEA